MSMTKQERAASRAIINGHAPRSESRKGAGVTPRRGRQ